MSLAETLIEKFENSDLGDMNTNPFLFAKDFSKKEIDEQIAVGGFLYFFKSNAYEVAKKLSSLRVYKYDENKYPMLLETLSSICPPVELPETKNVLTPVGFFNWLKECMDTASNLPLE